MANAKLEFQTEVMSRELRAHGVSVLRYRIAFPVLAGCDAVNEFCRQVAEQLRSDKLASGSRAERVGFREIQMKCTAEVVWSDESYVSILFDFLAADKDSIHRMVRLARTFELASGRICMPSEFIGKRKKAPSEEFYLTADGPVFLKIYLAAICCRRRASAFRTA